MPIYVDPRTTQRFLIARNSGDFVYESTSGNPTLDNEDVVNHTTEVTEFGETKRTHLGPQEAMWSGIANELQGSLAGLEGGNIEGFNVRGRSVGVYRSRKRFGYVANPCRSKKTLII